MALGCFVCKKNGRLMYTFSGGRFEAVCRELPMIPEIINEENYVSYREQLREVQFIFCTWDMIAFTKEQIVEFFPNLKVIFYAAGSVQYFAKPFMELGVRVVSAWRTMARPVAEYTVALITLANKSALAAAQLYKSGNSRAGKNLAQNIFPGTYDTNIGIIGAGAIGSIVIQMLRDYSVNLMVFDPFLSPARMAELGLERTYSLPEIFSQCQTISNHLANNEQTVGMLNGSLFNLMSDTAAFINTGRGAQVVEADLVEALREKPLRTAYLDVTFPEPVAPDHPFLSMPNVFLFPHIAGSATNEVRMFPDCMIDQYRRYRDGLPFTCEVSMDMLATMA